VEIKNFKLYAVGIQQFKTVSASLLTFVAPWYF